MLDRFALQSVLSTLSGGDHSAFRDLYEDRADQLYALTLRMLRNEELAAEALQNTFVEIWRQAQAGQATWEMPDLEMICIARAKAGALARRSPDRIGTGRAIDMADPVNQGTASFELLELLQTLGQISAESRDAVTFSFYELPTREKLCAHLGVSQEDLTTSLRRCYAEFVKASNAKTTAIDRETDLVAMNQSFGLTSVLGNAPNDPLRHAWELRLAPLAELLQPVTVPPLCFDAVRQRINADVSTTSGHANVRSTETWRAMLYVAVAVVTAVLVYFGLIAISEDAAAAIVPIFEENLR